MVRILTAIYLCLYFANGEMFRSQGEERLFEYKNQL